MSFLGSKERLVKLDYFIFNQMVEYKIKQVYSESHG